jgi:crotonobetainyl-CoA:carnitine CoA-transferase CaiB-like acyl-CoA transferase
MPHSPPGSGILSGIRVLDFSRMLSGPYCTMMLADHGAEVIKIESPEGDTSRTNGPYRDDDPEKLWAGYFVSLNRSKKGIVLDLKSSEGKAAVRELAKTSHVIVENFRPGVMERLELGYESLSESNPALVYAAIRGFGDPRSGESPYSNWPSYDVVAQAMGGLISMTGQDRDHPMKTGPGIGDVFTGLMMSFAIVAAVRHAEKTGLGQFVDIGMYDAMLSLCERMVYQYDMEGTVAEPSGNGHPLLAPFGLFPASDGWISIGVVDDAFWRELVRIMDRPEMLADGRLASKAGRRRYAAEVNEAVASWTRKLSKAELAQKLGGKLPFGPVNDAKDIFADPHVAARNLIASIPHPAAGHAPWKVANNPVHFSLTPAIHPTTPPKLGEDNASILGPASKLPPT